MWWNLLWVTLVVVALMALPVVLLYARRRWLAGQGGMFDCALRRSSHDPALRWYLGMGRYLSLIHI